MTINAITTAWSLPGTADASQANGAQNPGASFQATLLQWQEATAGSGTQGSNPGQAQPDQPNVAVHHHHHHHHEMDMDGGGQTGGGSMQSALASLVNDIGSSLQNGGSSAGGGSVQAAADTLVADIAGGARSSATGTANTANAASIQAAANTLAADIAQAMQAYGTAPPAAGSTIVSL